MIKEKGGYWRGAWWRTAALLLRLDAPIPQLDRRRPDWAGV